MNWFTSLFRAKPAPTPASAAPSADAPPALEHGLLRRRPIYDRHWRVVAYAVSLRRLPHAGETLSHSQLDMEILLYEIERLVALRQFTSRIWLDLEWTSLPLLAELIDTPHTRLTAVMHGAFPADGVNVSASLARLKQHGVALGASADGWQALKPEVLRGMQLITLGMSSPDLASLSQQIRQCRNLAPGAELWLNGVDSHEAAEAGLQLGANYISGRIFTNPAETQAQLPSEFIRLNHVLSLVRNGADFGEIAEGLKSDPVLSVRLLRYVNSAALGLPNPVHGLEQALAVLGQEKVYRWLSLLLFSRGNPQPLDDTLLEAALTRARLMELCGSGPQPSARGEQLYLTGLFSLLDYLLRVPRRLLLQELCAPAEVIDTLAGKATSLSPFLQLAEAGESDGDVPDDLLAACGLTQAEFGRHQMDATLWVLSALAE
ncbi:EAL and HDOD domain-containing protein [Chitinilyticum aquatile]|uniref:EAL and HDOD domain-containing protein n=1 Tax=Chitinilyticum aquatile TaxID=362520 RepID=UPI000410B1B1|nr:HDOD domain-containing protein [Chitinilyticum aquatile]